MLSNYLIFFLPSSIVIIVTFFEFKVSVMATLITNNNNTNNGKANVNNDGVHVVFVIDMLLKPRFDQSTLIQCLDAILAFGNSFLMQSGYNRLNILGSSSVKNAVLYFDENFTDDDQQQQQNRIIIEDQQNEQFALVTQTFHRNFLQWIQECRNIFQQTISDQQTQQQQPEIQQTLTSLLSGALAQALCMIHSYKNEIKNSRILVFSLGADHSDTYSSQYMKLINCFFAAQKINVLIDACSINMNRETEETVPVSASLEDQFAASVLQQGCDLTGGRYIRIHKVASILEHLFWCLTPSAAERQQYVLPPKHEIAPPAACFCHRKVLDIGYVCSVCLSIFCQFLPYCTTCNSNLFKSNLNQISKLKSSSSTVTVLPNE
uniref:General transcription factor IIH subunit 3 n=1 Tax=Dermatophagoides pteronyssinus TaxID=6956 RepID=A0A6P6XQL1_DERPT|nr:general transcription factor IIH subunit 3-like [Dermatophagoides pteronyssinus]